MSLYHRIEYALADAPDLPLLELCRAVRSTDVSMVATLARMVQLRRARGNVAATRQTPDNTAHVTCHVMTSPQEGSLRASSSPRRGR